MHGPLTPRARRADLHQPGGNPSRAKIRGRVSGRELGLRGGFPPGPNCCPHSAVRPRRPAAVRARPVRRRCVCRRVVTKLAKFPAKCENAHEPEPSSTTALAAIASWPHEPWELPGGNHTHTHTQPPQQRHIVDTATGGRASSESRTVPACAVAWHDALARWPRRAAHRAFPQASTPPSRLSAPRGNPSRGGSSSLPVVL